MSRSRLPWPTAKRRALAANRGHVWRLSPPFLVPSQALSCAQRLCSGTSSSSSSSTTTFSSTLSERQPMTPSVPAGALPSFDSLSSEDKELLETLQAAVETLGIEQDKDHPLVQTLDKVTSSYRDKAALLKRNWTDEMFQQGEDMNETRVAQIEADLALGLGASRTGLEDGVNLGNALDLVGVYMKNYMLDKADAVLARCGPYVSDRSGVWMVKWLNHVSTVRMKQGRSLEALEMLYELELYSPFTPEEAPEFFETLYRNMGWALNALAQIDRAAVYFERMAKVAKAHKGRLDWFDCWDIGKHMATTGFRDGDMSRFYQGRSLIEEALAAHKEAEGHDLVMRAKVLDSLAECFMIVEEYDRAEEHYTEAYDLLADTVGKNSPLFGKQARHQANLFIAQDMDAAALPFLGEALTVEASKDAVKVHEILDLISLLVNTQQRCGHEVFENLPSNNLALKAVQKNLKGRGLANSLEYGILCHKMSLIYLHEHKVDSNALRRARRLAKESVRLLRAVQGSGKDAADWLSMAELHARILMSSKVPGSRKQPDA